MRSEYHITFEQLYAETHICEWLRGYFFFLFFGSFLRKVPTFFPTLKNTHKIKTNTFFSKTPRGINYCYLDRQHRIGLQGIGVYVGFLGFRLLWVPLLIEEFRGAHPFSPVCYPMRFLFLLQRGVLEPMVSAFSGCGICGCLCMNSRSTDHYP